MEEFNLELKRAEDYLQAMINTGKANKEDCQNVQMHLDNINSIVKKLIIPRVIDCSTCKHQKVSKYVEPCYGCRDNDGYDHHESAIGL
jgi:hypothetical protein